MILISASRRSPVEQFGRVLILLIGCALVLGTMVAPTGLHADVHPRYFEGDWRAYTCVRFVTSYAETSNMIYFGTRGGIARFDRFKNRWLPTMTVAEGLPDNDIEDLAYNPLTDELFTMTRLGASSYQPAFKEWRDELNFPDSLSQRWRSTDISQFRLPFGFDALDANALTDPHLRRFPIEGAVSDAWGNTWVATWGDFIWRSEPGLFELVPQTWGLYHDNVESMYFDRKTIYFGGTDYYSSEGALTIYDTVGNQWHHIESRYETDFRSDRIRAFAGEKGGRYLWMGTHEGVIRYDRIRSDFRSYGLASGLNDDRVYSLCIDGDLLWVGTETGVNGIYLPSDSVFSASTEAISNARVYAIDVTDDVVWIGTDLGLFRLAKPVPEWRSFSTGTGPLAGVVRSLTHDDHYLYVASDRGVAVVDWVGSDPIQYYERPTAIPDDNIFDIAVTDSIIWLGTLSGLIRYVPATNEVRTITPDDGLLDFVVQTIEVQGDYLWLGTPLGVSRFRWNNPLRID